MVNKPLLSLKWRVLLLLTSVVVAVGLSQYFLLKGGLHEALSQQRAVTGKRLSAMLDGSFVVWAEKIEQMAGIIAAMQSLAVALESADEAQTRSIIARHANVLHLDLGVETIQVYDREGRLAMRWGGVRAANLDALVADVSATHKPRRAWYCAEATCFVYTIVPIVQSGPYERGVLALSFNLMDMLSSFIKLSGTEIRLTTAYATRPPDSTGAYDIRLEPKTLPLPKNFVLVARFNEKEERALLNRIWQRLLIFSGIGFLLLSAAVLLALWRPLKRLGHTASSFELLASGRFAEFRNAISAAPCARFADEVDVVNHSAIKAASGLEQLEAARAKRKLAQQNSLTSVRFVESEKKRIARELHDQLGQVLATVLFDARAIAQDNSQDLVSMQKRAGRIIESLSSLFAQVNNIIDSLRPEVLDTLGLGQALQSLIDHWHQVAPSCHFTLKMDWGLNELPDDINISLYRITQECFTNIMKHSNATKVAIGLTVVHKRKRDTVVLHIKDNGEGFDVDTTPAGGGLQSIRQRAEALGGNARFKSSPSTGTHVIVTLPLKPELLLQNRL